MRQRHTLLALAVGTALGSLLPAAYAQEIDRGSARTSSEDKMLWDRNEFRSTDMASFSDRKDGSLRTRGDLRHPDAGDHRNAGDHRFVDRQEIRQDKMEIRDDIREIREDRAKLQAELADRQHNREQLAHARAIGDTAGVKWEQGEI